MKLLINEDLNYRYLFISDKAENDDVRGYIEFLKSKLAKFSVRGLLFSTELGFELVIPSQKITLSEKKMNEFFAEFLNEFFDITLAYAWLGDSGCEFSLEIKSAIPRQ